MSDLVGNPEDRFSRVVAQIVSRLNIQFNSSQFNIAKIALKGICL